MVLLGSPICKNAVPGNASKWHRHVLTNDGHARLDQESTDFPCCTAGTLTARKFVHNRTWLVVSTPLKNISQLGLLFPIYGKIFFFPNHQPGLVFEPKM